jgi:hypothetical protein
VLGLQARDQVLEIVGRSSTVGGSNDSLWVHAELLGLGGPCSLDSGDRVGKRTILVLSAMIVLRMLRVAHHVKEDTICGKVGRVFPLFRVVSRLERHRVCGLLLGKSTGHCGDVWMTVLIMRV